jgi:hypothetical protein
MSALNVLVRKFRNAMGAGEPAPQPAPRFFNWESFPVSAPGTPLAPAPAAPLPPAPQGKTPPRMASRSSVIGAGIPADVASFATVYEAAGVTEPAHGYGVDRVGDMLDHKSFESLDRSVKAEAVLAALDAAGVSIQEVVHDAVLRFQALIAFEAAKNLERSGIAPRNEIRIEELQGEMQAFREERDARIAELRREAKAARQTLDRLRRRVRAEQDRYHAAVSLFVEPLPARVIPTTPSGGQEARATEAGPTEDRLPPAVTIVTIDSGGATVEAGAPAANAGEPAGAPSTAVPQPIVAGAPTPAEPKAE